MIIVIDPGHGGEDPGATGYGLVEKNINLFLAKAVQKALSGYDAEVRLTREGDTNPGFSTRANYANNLNAGYFLSVHTNAGGGTGFESFIHNNAPAATEVLRSTLHDEVARFYTGAGLPDRGKKKANFAVLRDTNMPAVLLENLFVDNPQDAAHLADSSFLNGVAKAVAGGLVKALNLKPVQVWDPAAEIARLKKNGIINSDHNPSDTVNWGELATVINRLIEKYHSS